MTYDPRKPAREKTPWGAFELYPTHLVTGTGRSTIPWLTAVEIAEAARLVAGHARDERDFAELCDALGIESP